jgi:dihydropteroate synthase
MALMPDTIAADRRLAPALEQLIADRSPVSVDSPRPETRRFAISGAAYLNDIHGFDDLGMYPFLGSTPEPSLMALAGIRELKDAFGVRVLVSPSRKSFVRTLTVRDVAQSGPATLAAEIFAPWRGADYIPTHDVAAARDAVTLLSAVVRQARDG